METMGRVWLDDPIEGFFGEVPLTTIALKDFNDSITNSFAVVPDANWYMIRSLYLHNVDDLGNKFTLAHLKKYNMEWGEFSHTVRTVNDVTEGSLLSSGLPSVTSLTFLTVC